MKAGKAGDDQKEKENTEEIGTCEERPRALSDAGVDEVEEGHVASVEHVASSSSENGGGDAVMVAAPEPEEERILSLRTRFGRHVTLPAPDVVKRDELALMLVERSGVPGAYHVTDHDREDRLSPQLQSEGQGADNASMPASSEEHAPSEQEQDEGAAVSSIFPSIGETPVAALSKSSSRDQSVSEENTDGDVPAVNASVSGEAVDEEASSSSSQQNEDDDHIHPAGQSRHFVEEYTETPITAHVAEEPMPRAGRISDESTLRIRDHLFQNVALVDSVVAVPDLPTDDQEKASAAKERLLFGRSRMSAVIVIATLVAIAAAISTAVVIATNGDGSPNPVELELSSHPTMMPSEKPSRHLSASPSSRYFQAEEDTNLFNLRDVVSGISGVESFLDPLSAQSRALLWLAYDDAMNLTDQDEEKLIQRYIAATLFFSSGDSADFLLGDIMLGDECTWNRVLNEFSWGIPGGIICSEDGIIKTINFGLYFRPLLGSFPHEIGYLSSLQQLIVYDSPGLVGTIPNSLTLLQDLKRIILAENGDGLGGTIPSFTAPSLREIIISGAPYNGTIPAGFENLGLVTLIIAETCLTGQIPEFLTDMEDLSFLLLGANNLTGSIPASLGQNQNNLTFVGLGGNTLNGTITNGLLGRQNMRGLFLYGNHLSGTIGSEIGMMANLHSLFLHSNALTSTIPPELGDSVNLKFLELGENRLNGTVPSSLGNLVHLESVSLVENHGLAGSLNFFCNMSGLNLFADCAVANSKLDCDCCDCCHGTSHTCGRYPDGKASTTLFLLSECCMKKKCGRFDCTGEQL